MEKGKRLPDTPSPDHYWSLSENMQIAGDTWGVSEDPLVFLLHGGGQTRHAWKNTGVTLAENGFYAVALDARGHGDSDWSPTGTYNQDVMVKDGQRHFCNSWRIDGWRYWPGGDRRGKTIH